MSLKDSSKMIAYYYRDFSSSSLTTTYAVVIADVGVTNLKAVYFENTSGKPVIVAYGATGSEKILDVTPMNGISLESLLVSGKMAISIKSGDGTTISTGKLLIKLYC